ELTLTWINALDERQPEGDGLARSRTRLPNDIAPLKQWWNRALLNQRWLNDAHALQRIHGTSPRAQPREGPCVLWPRLPVVLFVVLVLVFSLEFVAFLHVCLS